MSAINGLPGSGDEAGEKDEKAEGGRRKDAGASGANCARQTMTLTSGRTPWRFELQNLSTCRSRAGSGSNFRAVLAAERFYSVQDEACFVPTWCMRNAGLHRLASSEKLKHHPPRE
jgi:hypothetical protein